ncbi:hypothetical protein SY2F82_44150 [Streptomyces sp. Y2F8-2]|nr:hypothetical protein SY2F82_44150 [Streptomyces sp. Y2F8-2]
MHPPVGSDVFLDDPGTTPSFGPSRAPAATPKRTKRSRPTLAFRYASAPQAAPMTAVPYPG